MGSDSTSLIAQQADPAQLQDAMEAALASGRIADFCAIEDRLEDVILEDAQALMGAGNFAASSAQFEVVRALNQRLVDVLHALPAEAPAADETAAAAIDVARARGAKLLPRWTGYRDYATGMALRAAGRLSEAIDSFHSAVATWQASKDDPERITAARAMATMCEGLEEMRRANFAPASAKFMAARAQCKDADAMVCDMLYHLTASRASLFSGNLDAAIEHAEQGSAAAQLIIDQRSADVPAWVAASSNGDLHISEGWREVAVAERHRCESLWDEAIAASTRAQRSFERAAADYVATGLPQAEATQEQMLNQAAVLDMQIRQIQDQRDSEGKLLAQIASLQETIDKRDADVAGLVHALRNRGINVTSVAEATAQVDVNVQLVQQVENHVHDQLDELRRAVVADDSLDAATRERMVAGVDEALAGDQHGPGFRERAGSVVEKLGEMTKAAGIVAGPIPVMIGTLVSLVGRWAKGG